MSPLHEKLKELFEHLDKTPFDQQPTLTLPFVRRLHEVREEFEKEREFADKGGGCGFAGYGP